MFGSLRRENDRLRRLVAARTQQRDDARKLANTFRGNAARIAQMYNDATDLQHGHNRLERLIRACARYRTENGRLTRQVVTLQTRLDNAVGLDAPSLDLGSKWQERRADKPWPKFEELD